ncbi:Predicted nuclease of the RNAse H fold, HicB family [Duganella sacchari]|jgi:predicted RNase H-like HicB family nuclease|uniref:Predicted nuclease of the RNAse H fold, HicB family n=1 Tax=Duganella sacchari TaxID=551987 RepID=A0A1M7IDY7_9BURK|nr:type II toxin-antitoxin system HicB family antitoxin [Duganella sacchari]SHM38895.1 Predicted nuclease of the RNAse H fold, HicB family [Duganella sacchari]
MDIPILIQKTVGAKKYGVTVPDIPGCVTTGDTVDKAMSNATKAIYGHVGQLVEQGKPFEIRPSEVETLSQEPDYAGGIWALVSLDLARLDDPPDD